MVRYTIIMDCKIRYCGLVSPKMIQHNLIQNLASFFVEIDKFILKVIWKCKFSRIAKIDLNLDQVKRFKLVDFNTCYKARVREILYIRVKIENGFNSSSHQ